MSSTCIAIDLFLFPKTLNYQELTVSKKHSTFLVKDLGDYVF